MGGPFGGAAMGLPSTAGPPAAQGADPSRTRSAVGRGPAGEQEDL
jgi:hypothetical protein